MFILFWADLTRVSTRVGHKPRQRVNNLDFFWDKQAIIGLQMQQQRRPCARRGAIAGLP